MKPTATGPMTLAKDGATPSQLKIRTRSVLSRVATPAVRWITSMPTLVPAPVAIAARHSSTKCGVPLKNVEMTASRPPTAVTATASRTGR